MENKYLALAKDNMNSIPDTLSKKDAIEYAKTQALIAIAEELHKMNETKRTSAYNINTSKR